MSDTDLWRDRNKVFVAGLPLHADDDALYAKFRPFGEMFQSKVVYDAKTGRSKGFGFITFCEYVHALEAVDKMNQTKWENRVLNVRFLQPKAGGDANAAAPVAARRPAKVFGPCPEGCTTIYVGNLAYDITEEVLRKVFEKCGDIKAVRFAEHIETKEFRGFGYVQFYDSAACEASVKLDGMIVMGRPMNIDYGQRDEVSEKAREELQKKLKKGVCHKFQSGECTRGEDCKFAHVLKDQDAEELLQGRTSTPAATPVAVPTPVAAPTNDSDAPVCINFQKGKCKRGDLCRFQHLGATPSTASPTTVETTDVVMAEPEPEDDAPICQNYQKGKCKRGDACRFRHVDASATPSRPPLVRTVTPVAAPVAAPVVEEEDDGTPICQNYQKGKCKRGEQCRFRHADAVASTPSVHVAAPINEESMTTAADSDAPICQNYLKGKCKRGEQCRFRHIEASSVPVVVAVPEISVCQNFQRGRCTRGASCRFAHTTDAVATAAVVVPAAKATKAAVSGTDYQKRFQSVCYNWQNTKSCARGDNCPFFHEGASAPKADEENDEDDTRKSKEKKDKKKKKRKAEAESDDEDDQHKKKKKKKKKHESDDSD
ncbi:hypothetical protein Poli38472_008379 [Pythium oligandrum]|uniref:Uncharacterized protein n=1 Tax=Pythium oligandrum TaxID=41045 RepID=A0A8K1CLK5_PYTOL|nr:hypothetical protein Poli38472_008379 [Pythium oligandrum]|eukprot:TMW65737.1 hypothetical protein Poli38472_008379 [Pythium oligandrum]